MRSTSPRRPTAFAPPRPASPAHGWIAFAPDGAVLDAAAPLEGLFGLDRVSLLAARHEALCEPAFAASVPFRQLWQDLAHGKVVSGVHPYRHADGRTLHLHGAFTPVHARGGRVRRVVALFADLTAHVRAQCELEAFVHEAREALRGLASGQAPRPVRGQYGGSLGALATELNDTLGGLDDTLALVSSAAASITSAVSQLLPGALEESASGTALRVAGHRRGTPRDVSLIC